MLKVARKTLAEHCKLCGKKNTIRFNTVRTFVGKDLKRFYKNVTVTIAEGGGYEVHLDNRKLRTPLGTHFVVPNEALAQAVALEWDTQNKVINRNLMHMTKLSNTAIDNPTHRDKNTVVNGILDCLETDTICYRMEEPEELMEVQCREWDPVLNWIKERYDVVIEPTTGLGIPHVPAQTLETFRQHLNSYNDWALVGFQQIVECLKSLIISTALVDRYVNVERAVQLSRLEVEFQVEKWGNVEWYHDVDMMDLRARIASATLFTHLNCEDFRTKRKGDTAQQL